MNTTITDEQFVKLPKFVQNHIRRLEDQAARLTKRNAFLEDENRLKVESSNTRITDGASPGTAIPDFSEVEFQLSDQPTSRSRSTVSVRLRRDGKSVEVMGGDSISVIPESGNYVRVILREW